MAGVDFIGSTLNGESFYVFFPELTNNHNLSECRFSLHFFITPTCEINNYLLLNVKFFHAHLAYLLLIYWCVMVKPVIF